jgi:hypothetical protein
MLLVAAEIFGMVLVLSKPLIVVNQLYVEAFL